MTRFILLLLALLASGCSRTPSLDQNGDIDLVYRRCLGTGRTTDYLHVSTEFKMAKDLSYGPGQVASWVCRVHPSRKKEFMVQLAAALKRNRVDTIGKNTSSVADASSWSLRIQGADLEVDAVVDQPTDPTNPDAVWQDSRLMTMRGFVSDLPLLAELYAIKLPDEIIQRDIPPNEAREATATAGMSTAGQPPRQP